MHHELHTNYLFKLSHHTNDGSCFLKIKLNESILSQMQYVQWLWQIMHTGYGRLILGNMVDLK